MASTEEIQELSEQLNALQDDGAYLSGAEMDFIASFERLAMDLQDGCADQHYSGFDLAPSESMTPIARAQQIINSHHAASL